MGVEGVGYNSQTLFLTIPFTLLEMSGEIFPLVMTNVQLYMNNIIQILQVSKI